ncbi:hypothetical protein ACIPSE_11060 [Streptomyces sp. NPDC090106]|uniref:hypothetical protein n=1 Tax=Streptomyces sp. NPDC090106 TaxID=3365946 RepID=UPI0037F914A5
MIRPYLIDREDGGLHRIGVLPVRGGQWEDDYRVRIRGLAPRTAVDDLPDEIREVAAARGHMHSVRTLRRRLPALSPRQALAYVRALLDGDGVAPAELVEPFNPVPAAKTIREGKPSGEGEGEGESEESEAGAR